MSTARALSSQRSSTVMLPCTLPSTDTDLVLISPRISAFSPTVRTPLETISPSTLPSMISSFVNLIEPLISTSAERTFLVAEISAMVCLLVVVDCCFGGG